MSGDILILSDDSDLGALVRVTLEAAGHRCRLLRSVQDAEVPSEVDLIVFDGALPGVQAWLAELPPSWPTLRMSPTGRDPRDQEDRLAGHPALDLPLAPPALLLRVNAALNATPPGPPRSPHAETLQSLRAGFAENLGARLDALDTAVRAGDFDAAQRLADRLSSVAATFGFSQVAAASARISQVCEAHRAGRVGVTRELPALLARARAGSRAIQVPHPSPPPDDGLRVLIVHSNPELMGSASVIGRRRRLHLSRAQSLTAALEAADRHRPDLAVIEVQLGGLTGGLEVCVALRTLPGLAQLPVAFVSRRNDMGTRLAVVSAGGSLSLIPPLTEAAVEEAARVLVEDQERTPGRAVLFCEDEAERYRLRGALERESIEVATCGAPGLLLDTIAEQRPEVLVIDLLAQSVSPLALVRALRADMDWRDLPTLLVNGPDIADARLAALGAGADTWLPRSATESEIAARALRAVSTARAHRRRLSHDPLTGLLERDLLCEYLDARLSEARRRAETLSLCVLGLDQWHALGRAVGARVRREVTISVGRLLGDRFRKHDLQASWSENRFIVAFLNERPTTARLALTRVLDELRVLRFEDDHGRPFNVSASAGVASFPVDGTTIGELVATAEGLLDRAQAQGGDRVLV